MKNVDLICCGFPKRGDHRGTTGEMGLYYALTCRSIFKHQVQGDCCDREPNVREPNVNYPVSKHSRVRENHAYKWILGGFSENTLKTFYGQITPSCSCQALKSVRLWWKPVEACEWYTDHGDEPKMSPHLAGSDPWPSCGPFAGAKGSSTIWYSMLYHRFFPMKLWLFYIILGVSICLNLLPIGSMLYMVTFTINIPPILAYIPYMDPMGMVGNLRNISEPWNIRALSRRLMAKVISGLRDYCWVFYSAINPEKSGKGPNKNPEIKISIGYIIHDVYIHYIEMPQTLGCCSDHDSCLSCPAGT